MSKPSGFLSRIEMQKKAEIRAMRLICIQQCKDMMLIAANDAFGFGADRLKRFADAYDAVFEEFAQMVVEDAKDDQDIWYSTGKCEERLREILGVHYVPREERYK